jgi:hypothetical protein
MGVDARERLRRLAVVFAVELRMKIVIELYMREMSAKQFFEQFGGGTSSRVSQNFLCLADGGWLRYLHSKGPGGKRRGGVEHFYRATELPFIDSESWALVPYSVRATSTWNFLKQVLPRLRGDMEASAIDAPFRRGLSCTTLQLDSEGWSRSSAAVSGQFARLFEGQEDARRRTVHSGEELIRSDVFLIAFEPYTGIAESAVNGRLVECVREPLVPFSQRLAPILEDDVRLGIASASNEREVSVPQLHREISGISRAAVGRRVKGLEGDGWLAKGKILTGGARRAGGEQFYRATKPAVRDFDLTGEPPPRLAGAEAWSAFEELSELAKDALIAGTFDMRADRCLSWSLISLDRRGWENVIAELESLSHFLSEEEARAKLRIAKSGETPIPLTVGLGAYEALKEFAKAP